MTTTTVKETRADRKEEMWRREPRVKSEEEIARTLEKNSTFSCTSDAKLKL